MKIKVNAIGLGESKWLKIGEGFMVTGIIVLIGGFVIMRKTQCWTVGKTEDHLGYFKTIIDELHSAF